MKYTVGEKARVKRDLIEDEKYGDYTFTYSMGKLKGKIVTIKSVYDGYYTIKEDGYSWTDEMLEDIKRKTKKDEYEEDLINKVINKFTDTVKERDEKFNTTLERTLDSIVTQVNQRTIYDDIIQDQVLQKAKELSLKDIEKQLHKDIDKYVKENYGVLPKKIEIKTEDKKIKLEGIFHSKFEEILKIVKKGIPLMLTGPAGAGKNYTLEQVAKALDLTFYTTNAVTQDFKLTGFIDANGKYHETEFYKAFKDGGLFFLDEVDASSPEALIILNGAIANGYFDFPNGRISANENFRVVCAGNTYGTGADMIYVGRNVLDGATLDRFIVMEFDYDEKVEKQLAYDDDLYSFIKNLRDTINKCGLRYITSMRALINATKLLEIGVDKQTILKTTIVKNMQKDDLNTVVNELNENNSWYPEIKRLCD